MPSTSALVASYRRAFSGRSTCTVTRGEASVTTLIAIQPSETEQRLAGNMRMQTVKAKLLALDLASAGWSPLLAANDTIAYAGRPYAVKAYAAVEANDTILAFNIEMTG